MVLNVNGRAFTNRLEIVSIAMVPHEKEVALNVVDSTQSQCCETSCCLCVSQATCGRSHWTKVVKRLVSASARNLQSGVWAVVAFGLVQKKHGSGWVRDVMFEWSVRWLFFLQRGGIGVAKSEENKKERHR